MPFLDQPTSVPAELRTDDYYLRPITVDDTEIDWDAVMDSRAHLRLWEQSSWPEDDFTIEDDRKDLVGLVEQHHDRRSFTYTVLSPDQTDCLGCVYVFPPDVSFIARNEVTAVGAASWDDVDAAVYFWVRPSLMDAQLDEGLLAALRDWMAGEWGFSNVVFGTSSTFEQQVQLLELAGLTKEFEFYEHDKPAPYVLFG